jgi:DNA-binding MarR family transcriptional regulator
MLVQGIVVEMATDIEKTIAEKLSKADEEVNSAALAYSRARRRRAKVYAGAAEVLSQKQIAELTGITQQRVSQVIQEASKKPLKKRPVAKVNLIRDA